MSDKFSPLKPKRRAASAGAFLYVWRSTSTVWIERRYELEKPTQGDLSHWSYRDHAEWQWNRQIYKDEGQRVDIGDAIYIVMQDSSFSEEDIQRIVTLYHRSKTTRISFGD